MTKCFCDVCGVEISGEYRIHPAVIQVVELCGLEDLCPRCDDLVIKMDAAALVLAELRRLASRAEVDVPDADAPPSAVLTGRCAREKRDIMNALEAYRKEQGPGCIPRLAKQAKVGEDDLRDMISRKKVPLSKWRAVGKALGVVSAEAKGRPGNGAAGQE